MRNASRNDWLCKYDGKINTKFHDDEIPKKGSYCICLSVILTDFVFEMGKNYHLQVFLEE